MQWWKRIEPGCWHSAYYTAMSSCLTALDSQIVTLLSVPHEILFLQHKVFREYAKIAVGPDFIHTLPSLLILVSMAIVLWRSPPSYNGLAQITGPLVYKSLQVLSIPLSFSKDNPLRKCFKLLVSWVVVIAILWFWLMWQRLIYCCVWTSWSHVSIRNFYPISIKFYRCDISRRIDPVLPERDNFD